MSPIKGVMCKQLPCKKMESGTRLSEARPVPHAGAGTVVRAQQFITKMIRKPSQGPTGFLHHSHHFTWSQRKAPGHLPGRFFSQSSPVLPRFLLYSTSTSSVSTTAGCSASGGAGGGGSKPGGG